MIVDPDGPEAQVVQEYLEADGYVARVTHTAADAMLALGESAADLVICDIYARGMPGETFIGALRSGSPWGTGPGVIIMSEDDDAESAVNALHAGADDYIVKPLGRERLKRAIDRVLERRMLMNETARLRRDLSLFAAGQRLLETLDEKQIVSRGLSALASFTASDAVALCTVDSIDARGLEEEELQALESVRFTALDSGRTTPDKLSDGLTRFADALLVEVGDNHRAVLLRTQGRSEGFAHSDEQNALFLARHLSMGLRNVSRFSQAEQRARRDPLTGVLNGHAFVEALQHSLVRAGLEERTHALLFCDLDYFKNVNDEHGHLVGSQLLIELATRLVRCVRDADVIGRYGGDEFVMLLTDVDETQAMSAAERIRRSIETRPFLLRGGGPTVNLTACLGVALFPSQAVDARTLLDLADRAMYEGKGGGRNAVRLATGGE
jgi:diguanylate cyclase (GGDEF)-like protein